MFTRRAFIPHTGAGIITSILAPRSRAEGSDKPISNDNSLGLSNAEKILFNTIRLVDDSGKTPISGTGFIFAFFHSATREYPVIVTNRHVVEPMKSCTFLFHKQLTAIQPDYFGTLPVTISDVSSRRIPHKTQDLAIIPIDTYINDLANKGTPPFRVAMTRSNVPNDDELNALNPIEEVLTVGYPSGLTDPLHNLPLFHSGHTATPPFLPFPTVVKDPEHGDTSYQNDKTFAVDFTTWFGSSGSPVFIYNTRGFTDRSGAMHPLTQRIMLLGIVEGLVSMPVPGAITLNVVPNAIQGTQTVNIPANLGMCLSSSSILDFEQILMERGVVPNWEYDSGRK
jgi:Trypsin-like peptidase domain